MSLLLHGVVRVNHPAVTALPHVVTWQDLAAVVGEPGSTDQEAHMALLSTLVTDGPVVPLRFGTTAVDEDVVRAEVLAGAATHLRSQLDRLSGLVEVHAYLTFDESEALQAMFDERRSDWRATGGLDLYTRVRLSEQVAQRLVVWRRARSDALLAPVAAAARDHIALPDREPTEERRAFLLPHEELPPARAAITALRHLAGVGTRCVGPLPAYNFLTEPASREPRWGW